MKKNCNYTCIAQYNSSKQENSKQIVVFWKMVTLHVEATSLSESADWNSRRKSKGLRLIFHIIIAH